jgi:hypothetical protein
VSRAHRSLGGTVAGNTQKDLETNLQPSFILLSEYKDSFQDGEKYLLRGLFDVSMFCKTKKMFLLQALSIFFPME